MIIKHKISEINNMFVVINKGDKSIGIFNSIYSLFRLYNIFFVSLYESWIDGQSDELKNTKRSKNENTNT